MPEALGLRCKSSLQNSSRAARIALFTSAETALTITRLGIRVPAAAYCSDPVTCTSNNVEGLTNLPRLH